MKKYVLVQPRIIPQLRINHFVMFAFAFIVSFMVYKTLNRPQQPKQQFFAPVGNGENSDATVSPVPYDVVFVSRKIVKHGANDLDSLTDMPGVGPHSRFRDCAPGKLRIYKINGTLVTLIDGNNPTVASLNLIDVNAPDVSYDGTQILFAGLPAPIAGQTYDTLPKKELGAWRIYKINVNGTGLTQLTTSSLVINNAQFNVNGGHGNDFSKYDDIDPIWLPDGRICFSSSRAPSTAEYGGARTTNLWVMTNSGASQHRITSERNGAERSMVDPLTGKIVFSRWWRNGRFPLDDMSTIANSTATGYLRKDGLSSDGAIQSVAPNFLSFNGWVAAEINPDGTELELFSGGRGSNQEFMMYGGSFTSTGNLVSNYFPQNKLTPEGGFGGLNTHVRGVGTNQHLAGLTYTGGSGINAPVGTPDSMLRYFPIDGFASDANVLPNDKVIMSWAPNYNQDYGLYVIDATGANKTLIYNAVGTTELRAKAIHVRTLPPIITDQITQVASLYPPLAAGPYNTDGTFTFKCLNVFGNGPVDMDITSAPAIGKVNSIRFFINHQRTRIGSDSEKDWPIQLTEMTVPPNGAVTNPNAPANVPLFEQLRSSTALGYVVPTTGAPFPNSTAHVAGMNYGRPGAVNTCIGCHRGHTLIDIPVNEADAEFTNLAPGATVQVSSGDTSQAKFLVDRQVQLAFVQEHYWTTPNHITTGQYARLKFAVPIKVKTVIPYNIPSGGTKASSLQVHSIQVNLYADANATQLVSSQTINQDISVVGTGVTFNNVVAQCVEVKILNVTGTYGNHNVAGLAEIEVIASGNTIGPRFAQTESSDIKVEASVYPNPIIDEAHLFLQGKDNGAVSYTVYNIHGEIISRKQVEVVKGISTEETINLAGEPQGIYMIRVDAGNETKTFRLVKI